MIISVAGPSCSGKTTLCKKLSTEFSNSVLLHLDLFWIEQCSKPEVMGIPSREQPHQYDGAAMARYASCLINEHIIMEGFLALRYPEVVAMSDIMFYIDVPHEVQKERRISRTQNGGNPVWQTNRDIENNVDKSWLLHGEHEWNSWGTCQKDVPGVIVIDGLQNIDVMLSTMATKVRETNLFRLFS